MEYKDSSYFLIPSLQPLTPSLRLSVHPPELHCQLQSFASVGMEQLTIQPEAVARAGVSVAAEKAATMEAKTTLGFLAASTAVCSPLAL